MRIVATLRFGVVPLLDSTVIAVVARMHLHVSGHNKPLV
jgi:hypothetical protein